MANPLQYTNSELAISLAVLADTKALNLISRLAARPMTLEELVDIWDDVFGPVAPYPGFTQTSRVRQYMSYLWVQHRFVKLEDGRYHVDRDRFASVAAALTGLVRSVAQGTQTTREDKSDETGTR